MRTYLYVQIVCKLYYFLSLDCCSHIDNIKGVLIFAPNDGLQENVHNFKVTEPITDDTECKPIRLGPRVAATVAEFNEKAVQYYKDHLYCGEFPPTFFLEKTPTTNFVDMVSKFSIFANPVKIIVHYDPLNHMKIFGYDDRKCKEREHSRCCIFKSA